MGHLASHHDCSDVPASGRQLQARSRVPSAERQLRDAPRHSAQAPGKAPIEVPAELLVAIQEFWPAEEWENAKAVAALESGLDAFALNDTTTEAAPCGTILAFVNGIPVTAERSFGYFQINACNLPPTWVPEHLYNARHNAGTAHMLWDAAGQSWRPWFFTAKSLGLV